MRSLLLILLSLSFTVGCDTNDEVVEPTSCDFSSIAGTWTGASPFGEDQSMTLQAQADFDASIGTNVFSNDGGPALCTFDVQCKPSESEGVFLVFNEAVSTGACLEGWYTMTPTASGALAVDLHLTEDGDTIQSYELTQE
ncbi:MAG: hypothetical protein ACI9KE_002591 [Polyangiales bacterium]|jgi:hypothetical protein